MRVVVVVTFGVVALFVIDFVGITGSVAFRVVFGLRVVVVVCPFPPKKRIKFCCELIFGIINWTIYFESGNLHPFDPLSPLIKYPLNP